MPSPSSEPIFAEGFFALGNERLAQNQLDGAQAAYRRALMMIPGFAEALCNCARLFHRQNREADALPYYRRALHLSPGMTIAQHGLAAALLQLKQTEEAVAVLRDLLRNHPDDIEALSNLGTALLSLKDFAEAERQYRRALVLAPENALTLFNLGTTHQDTQRHDTASVLYRRVLSADPAFTIAWYNYGTACEKQGHFDEAIAAYRMVTERQPDNADGPYNLGILYQGRGMLDEAVEAYGEAVRRRPDRADVRFNLGTVFQERQQLDEAMAFYQSALDHVPQHQEARVNLGTALLDRGRVSEAGAAYDEAAKQGPMPEAHWNLALVRLLQGDLRTGWAEYEWRWKTAKQADDVRSFNAPRWRGEPGGGRTILLHVEQGLGDTVQFCRYLPLVAERGWRVVLEVQAPLRRLLSAAFEDAHVIALGEELPPFDAYCPLMSLPYVFDTTLETIPAPVSYLHATGTAQHDRLVGATGLKVGIVWAGNPAHRNDKARSLPVERLRALLETPGVTFFSLQKEPREGDRDIIATWGVDLVDLGPTLGDFTDTAAVLEALDLMIVVDTSVAHLSGALGRPTWVLLPVVPDWRWLLEREDSPWYPTARLFRRGAAEDWDGVLERVGQALVRWRDERLTMPIP